MSETATPPAAEVYGLYGTWPRFRFAERDIGAKWEVVAAVDDASLARGGYRLAGQVRDASDLDREFLPELATLLRESGNLNPERDARLAALLECCPFAENLPPVDVDPQDATPEQTRAFAEAFDAAWREMGLGTIQWFETGGRGLHGKLAMPTGLRSPFLMRAYGALVRRVARHANLPLLTNFREKKGRPPILIDDSLFDRDAAGRGGLWRLEGAPHTKTGRVKKLAGLHDEPPTVSSECERRIRQALDNLDELAKTGELRRKPRARQAGKLPKPLTELQERRLLVNLAEAVKALTPPEGMRHDFRKALAGWMIREGVPPRVAGATIAVAGDPSDAAAVAKTTASRLASGRNAFGFRKLLEIVGQGGGLALKAALHADLRAANVAPKDLGGMPDEMDRATLREAARLADAAGHATRARGLRRAARCGLAMQDLSCGRCGSTQGCRHVVSERATCPHCAIQRTRSVLNWCMTKWPTKLWIFRKKLADDSLEVARTERKRWTRKLRKERRANVRWIIAPGWLVAVTHDFMTGALIGGWVSLNQGWQAPDSDEPNEQGRSSQIMVLEPILKARALHLREHLDAADPQGLANDAWCDKVMEASGGSVGRQTMPWPKKRDLRLMAVNAARARQNLEPLAPGATFSSLTESGPRRSACCEDRINYRIRDSKTKEVIGVRNDRPWTFAEASVRAENGWRGEELRFALDGTLLVDVRPAGWDADRLRE